jgi:hypothetical protein
LISLSATTDNPSGLFVSPCSQIKTGPKADIDPKFTSPPELAPIETLSPIQEMTDLSLRSRSDGPRCRVDRSKTSMASLFSTIGTGDLGRVRMLIDQGVDIESKDIRGRTVLHKAVQKATPAITALLLEKGSKPNVHDYQGDTPLHMAI